MLESDSHRASIIDVSPDGRLIASAPRIGRIRLWDATTGTSRACCEKVEYTAVTFSPKGEYFATANMIGDIEVWDTVGTFVNHLDIKHALSFPLGTQLLLCASNGQEITLWDLEAGTNPIATVNLLGYRVAIGYTIALSADGKEAVSSLPYTGTCIWSALTGKPRIVLRNDNSPYGGAATSRSGKLIATTAPDYNIQLWDATTGHLHALLQGHVDMITSLAFSPDSNLIASGGDDGIINLWDSREGTLCGTFEGHSSSVLALAFSPDSKQIISSSDDCTIRTWETSGGGACTTKEYHSAKITGMAITPDGKLVASGSDDCTVRLWDTTKGAESAVLHHSAYDEAVPIAAVAFSPDSKILTSRTLSGIIQLWDVTTRQLRARLEDNLGYTWNTVLNFSQDGRLLLAEPRKRGEEVRDWKGIRALLSVLISTP